MYAPAAAIILNFDRATRANKLPRKRGNTLMYLRRSDPPPPPPPPPLPLSTRRVLPRREVPPARLVDGYQRRTNMFSLSLSPPPPPSFSHTFSLFPSRLPLVAPRFVEPSREKWRSSIVRRCAFITINAFVPALSVYNVTLNCSPKERQRGEGERGKARERAGIKRRANGNENPGALADLFFLLFSSVVFSST